MDLEVILSAYIITEDTLELQKRAYGNVIMSAKPGRSVEFKPGMYIVSQMIHTVDLFDSTFKCSNENAWLATAEEFNEKFTIVNDGNRTDLFFLIAKK